MILHADHILIFLLKALDIYLLYSPKVNISNNTNMISSQVIQKVSILATIILVAILLILSLYNRTSNLGQSIGNLRVLKKSTINYLSDVIEPKEYVVFYSTQCKSCMRQLPWLKKQKNMMLICLDNDYPNSDPDVSYLIDRNKVKIAYLPYIVRVDSNYKIIKELKSYEIKSQLNN